jgi:hypothetical protein
MLKKARDDAELEIKTYRDKKQREFEDQRKSVSITFVKLDRDQFY